jgi:pimeloyl-ACP methyl ester carboxylesterase
MAADVVGLMDFLELDRATIAGMSMGGMIAQIAAAEYPDRVSSLGIIMSTTGQALLPTPTLPAFAALMKLFRWPINNGSATEYFGDTLRFFKSVRSSDYWISDSELEDSLDQMFARSANDPEAVRRQFLAAFGAGDIRAYSRAITAKTVVIHGASDPLMRPGAGKAGARCIKGSRLEVIPGMGHHLHPELWDRVISSLHENAASSRSVQERLPI